MIPLTFTELKELCSNRPATEAIEACLTWASQRIAQGMKYVYYRDRDDKIHGPYIKIKVCNCVAYGLTEDDEEEHLGPYNGTMMAFVPMGYKDAIEFLTKYGNLADLKLESINKACEIAIACGRLIEETISAKEVILHVLDTQMQAASTLRCSPTCE